MKHDKHALILESVLNSYESPVFSLDTNYCYTSFNQAHADEMKSIYGSNIFLGANVLDYMTDKKDRESSKLDLDEVLQGNTVVKHAFYGTSVRKYYEVIHNPMRDISNNIIGLSVYVRDITERKQLEEERDKLIKSLQDSLNEIETLQGIIPICSYCHSIRDDEGAWSRLEEYLSAHSDAKFSHGVCPKCLPKARADAGLDNNNE